MTRCAIYTRVTTDDQTIENQLIILREIAQKKGLKVVTELNDEGISGTKGREKRTGFDNLIKGAIKKDFDTILLWRVDRLGRSLQDLVSFLNEVPIYQLAVNMGTSVEMIEDYYSHAKVRDKEFASSMTKGNQRGSSKALPF